MIVGVIDAKQSAPRARRICATIAGFAAFNGSNVLILPFENYTQDSTEKILYHDYNGESYGNLAFEERGIDALLSEAAMNNISKDTFYENVTAFSKNRRFDVADVTRKSNLVALLEERKDDVITLLTAADQVYDYVFVMYGDKSPREVFGSYAKEVEDLTKATIFVTRQGEWAHARDIIPVKEGKKAEYPANSIFVATKYDPTSQMTMKVCAKRLDASASQVYPLAEPISFRDATDNNKLQPYLRLNKNAANEFDNDANLWAQNLNDILSGLKNDKRPQPCEDWGVQELERKSLNVLPQTGEDDERLPEVGAVTILDTPETNEEQTTE